MVELLLDHKIKLALQHKLLANGDDDDDDSGIERGAIDSNFLTLRLHTFVSNCID